MNHKYREINNFEDSWAAAVPKKCPSSARVRIPHATATCTIMSGSDRLQVMPSHERVVEFQCVRDGFFGERVGSGAHLHWGASDQNVLSIRPEASERSRRMPRQSSRALAFSLRYRSRGCAAGLEWGKNPDPASKPYVMTARETTLPAFSVFEAEQLGCPASAARGT